jgi:DNA-directed RNA polymerase subunit RPC12/RpoP
MVDPNSDYRQPEVSSDSVTLLDRLGRLPKTRNTTMGQDITFSGRCSRCGNQSIAKPNRLELEAKMACEVCGHSGTVVEFADISVLEAILKQITDAARLVH